MKSNKMPFMEIVFWMIWSLAAYLLFILYWAWLSQILSLSGKYAERKVEHYFSLAHAKVVIESEGLFNINNASFC